MHLIRSANECCTSLLLRLHFYAVLSFIIVSFNGQLMEVRPGEPASDLCFNHSSSCSHQSNVFNLSEDACRMIYHRVNHSACLSSNFIGIPDVYESFGKMTLHSYLYKVDGAAFTSFNVSFTNIKWTSIHMRFIENQVKDASLCREFQVEPEHQVSIPNIFFDCLWSLEKEQKFYHFDYKAVSPEGETYVYKYIFNVPEANRIDLIRVSVTDWEIFLVVDVTAAPKTLILRLQVAPPSLNITGYKVEILRTLGLERPWPVLNRTLPANENDTELRFEFTTKLKFGKYRFVVEPVHPLCARGKCKKSCTPEILIEEAPIDPVAVVLSCFCLSFLAILFIYSLRRYYLEMTEPKLLTGIVVTCLCIPLLLLTYFMWKRNCDTKEPCPEPPGPPKFLMMYKPASIDHLRKIMELHKYFNKVCGIHSMLDQFGIPQTISKDPVSWYTLAFKEADFVGIFASPETTPAEREAVLSYNPYLNTEVVAHNHLKTYLCLPGARCKFFSILLPGTKWETLPPQAQALKRYTLPRDLDPLLVLVGVTPQCDHGEGFNEALTAAAVPESPTVLTMAVPPRPVPADDPREGSSRLHEQPDESSLCCSDVDLVSSRQYLSDMSTASSMDHISLLADFKPRSGANKKRVLYVDDL